MITTIRYQRKWKLFTALGAAIVLVIGSLGLVRQSWLEEKEYLSHALSEFIIPPVAVKSEHYYVIKNGAVSPIPRFFEERGVLRLAQYALLNRIDPILALSGANIEQLRASIGALEKSLNLLAETGKWGSESKKLRSLHPMRFLKLLPELEKKRREAIEAPTMKIAKKYQQGLEEALSIAIGEIENLQQNIEYAKLLETKRRNKVFDEKFEVFLLRTSTDMETFIQALDDVKSALRLQQKKVHARGGCLTIWKTCREMLAFGWAGTIRNIHTPEPRPVSAINPEVLQLITSYWEKHRAVIFPKTLVVSTECFGGGKTAHPFLLSFDSPEYLERFFPGWKALGVGQIFEANLLDNIYFANILALPSDAQTFYRPLTEKGFTLAWQPATNLYNCSDNGYLSRLLTLQGIAEELRSTPLFRNVVVASDSPKSLLLQELAKAENKLISNKSIVEDDVSSFISQTGSLFLGEGEYQLQQMLGKDVVVRSEELVQRFFQNGESFSDIISLNVFRNFRFAELPQAPASLFHAFLTYSHPSLYFMTFNQTVLGDSPSPSFTRNSETQASRVFTDLIGAKKIYTLKRINELIHNSINIFSPFDVRAQ